MFETLEQILVPIRLIFPPINHASVTSFFLSAFLPRFSRESGETTGTGRARGASAAVGWDAPRGHGVEGGDAEGPSQIGSRNRPVQQAAGLFNGHRPGTGPSVFVSETNDPCRRKAPNMSVKVWLSKA